MFIFLSDQKIILNVSEIARIEQDQNEIIVKEFEGLSTKDMLNDIIFIMRDGKKYKVKGNIEDIWKILQKTIQK